MLDVFPVLGVSKFIDPVVTGDVVVVVIGVMVGIVEIVDLVDMVVKDEALDGKFGII